MSHPQDRQQRPEEEHAAQPPAMVGEQRRRHRRHHRAKGANDADGAKSNSNAGTNCGYRPHHHTQQQPHARPRQARVQAGAMAKNRGYPPDGSDDNGTDPNEGGGKEVGVASAKGDSDPGSESPSLSTSAGPKAASTSSRDPSRQDAGENREEGAARSVSGPPPRRQKEDYSMGHRPSTGGRCDDNDNDAEGNEDDSPPGGKNCGRCKYCLDMVKFGGPGRLRQMCVVRKQIMLRQRREGGNRKRWEEQERDLVATATRLASSPLETNCGTCKSCLDKVEFGGTGTLKHACLTRRRMRYKRKMADETAAARKTKDDGMDEAEGAVAVGAKSVTWRNGLDKVEFGGTGTLKHGCLTRRLMRYKKKKAEETALARWEEQDRDLVATATRLGRSALETNCGTCKSCLDKLEFGGTGTLKHGCLTRRRMWYKKKKADETAAARKTKDDAADEAKGAVVGGTNCGTCRNCLDMVKFGGTDTLKHGCLTRRRMQYKQKKADESAAATWEEQEWDLVATAARLGRSALETNCGTCKNCLDKLEFGGTGTLQQGCLTRRRMRSKKKKADEMAAAWKTTDDGADAAEGAVAGGTNCGMCRNCLDMVTFGGTGTLRRGCNTLRRMQDRRKRADEAAAASKRKVDEAKMDEVEVASTAGTGTNCDTCKNCLDMEQFGGTGRRMQGCITRKQIVHRKKKAADSASALAAATANVTKKRKAKGQDGQKRKRTTVVCGGTRYGLVVRALDGVAMTPDVRFRVHTGHPEALGVTCPQLDRTLPLLDSVGSSGHLLLVLPEDFRGVPLESDVAKKANMVSLKEQRCIKVDREVWSPLHLQGGEDAEEEEIRTTPIKNYVSPEMKMVASKRDGRTDGDADVDTALPPLLSPSGEDVKKKIGQAVTTEKDETTETGMVAPKDERGAEGGAYVDAALPPFRSCSKENVDKWGSQQATRSYYRLLPPQGSPFMTRLLTVGALLVIAFVFRRLAFFSLAQ